MPTRLHSPPTPTPRQTPPPMTTLFPAGTVASGLGTGSVVPTSASALGWDAWRSPLSLRSRKSVVPQVKERALPPEFLLRHMASVAVHEKVNVVATCGLAGGEKMLQIIDMPVAARGRGVDMRIATRFLFSFPSFCYDLSWSRNRLLAAVKDGTVLMYRLDPKEPMGTARTEPVEQYVSGEPVSEIWVPGKSADVNYVSRVHQSPLDLSRFLTVENRKLHVWLFERPKRPELSEIVSSRAVVAGEWSPHTPQLAVVGGGSVRVIDTRCIGTGRGSASVAWRMGGSGSGSGSWSGSASDSGFGVSDVKFSPLLPHILATAGEDSTINVWDTRWTGSRPLRTLIGHTATVSRVAWSPAHVDMLVSGGDDALLSMWCIGALPPHHHLALFPGHFHASVSGVGFLPETPNICIGGAHDGHLTAFSMSPKYLEPLSSAEAPPGTHERQIETLMFQREYREAFELAIQTAKVISGAEGRVPDAIKLLSLCTLEPYASTPLGKFSVSVSVPPSPIPGDIDSAVQRNQMQLAPSASGSVADASALIRHALAFNATLLHYRTRLPETLKKQVDAAVPSNVRTRLQSLRLSLTVLRHAQLGDGSAVIEMADELVEAVRDDPDSLEGDVLLRVVQSALKHDYPAGMRLGARIGHAFKVSSRFASFDPIARRLIGVTVLDAQNRAVLLARMKHDNEAAKAKAESTAATATATAETDAGAGARARARSRPAVTLTPSDSTGARPRVRAPSPLRQHSEFVRDADATAVDHPSADLSSPRGRGTRAVTLVASGSPSPDSVRKTVVRGAPPPPPPPPLSTPASRAFSSLMTTPDIVLQHINALADAAEVLETGIGKGIGKEKEKEKGKRSHVPSPSPDEAISAAAAVASGDRDREHEYEHMTADQARIVVDILSGESLMLSLKSICMLMEARAVLEQFDSCYTIMCQALKEAIEAIPGGCFVPVGLRQSINRRMRVRIARMTEETEQLVEHVGVDTLVERLGRAPLNAADEEAVWYKAVDGFAETATLAAGVLFSLVMLPFDGSLGSEAEREMVDLEKDLENVLVQIKADWEAYLEVLSEAAMQYRSVISGAEARLLADFNPVAAAAKYGLSVLARIRLRRSRHSRAVGVSPARQARGHGAFRAQGRPTHVSRPSLQGLGSLGLNLHMGVGPGSGSGLGSGSSGEHGGSGFGSGSGAGLGLSHSRSGSESGSVSGLSGGTGAGTGRAMIERRCISLLDSVRGGLSRFATQVMSIEGEEEGDRDGDGDGDGDVEGESTPSHVNPVPTHSGTRSRSRSPFVGVRRDRSRSRSPSGRPYSIGDYAAEAAAAVVTGSADVAEADASRPRSRTEAGGDSATGTHTLIQSRRLSVNLTRPQPLPHGSASVSAPVQEPEAQAQAGIGADAGARPKTGRWRRAW